MDDSYLGSPEAEEYVIGGVLTSPQSVLKIMTEYKVDEEWFFIPRWRYTYKAIDKLHVAGRTIEPASVIAAHKRHAEKDYIGKIALNRAIESCRDVRNIRYYLDLMQDKYTRRILKETAEYVLREIKLDSAVDEVVGHVKMRLASGLPQHREVESVDQKLEQLGVQFANAEKKGTTGLPYRWPQLNAMTGGMPRGKVIVVGSRPKIGKTMFAMNQALFLAQAGEPVGIIELEMLEMELRERLIGDDLGIELFDYRTGKASKQDIQAFIEKGKEHTSLPLHIFDKPRTIENICMCMRDRADEVPFWVVDYMQRIKQSKFDPRSDRERYERYSNMITDVANETGITVMAICQLNRDAEFDIKGKRVLPAVKTLKGSGAFEQDAHQVILLGRCTSMTGDVQYDTEQPTKCIVGYNRTGHTGQIDYIFQKDKQRLIEAVEKGSE